MRLFALALVASTALAQAPAPPKELAALEQYFGPWVSKEVFETPDGPSERNKGQTHFRWGPGRMSVIQEVRTTGPSGTQELMSVYTYDPKKKQYVAYWFSNLRPVMEPLTGKLEGEQLVFSGMVIGPKGAPAFLRITLTPVAGTSFSSKFEMGKSSKQIDLRWAATYDRKTP